MADEVVSDLALARFLINLATNAELRTKFNDNPQHVLATSGLDTEAIKLILASSDPSRTKLFFRLHLSNQNAKCDVGDALRSLTGLIREVKRPDVAIKVLKKPRAKRAK